VADGVAIATRLLELWNGGERERLEEVISPDFQLDGPFSGVSGEPYRGRAGFRRWLADIEEQFERWEIHAEPRELSAGCVLVSGHVHVRGQGSGVELDQPAAALVELRGDRVQRLRIFTSEAEALAAASAAG